MADLSRSIVADYIIDRVKDWGNGKMHTPDLKCCILPLLDEQCIIDEMRFLAKKRDRSGTE